MSTINLHIELPQHYRSHDILLLYGRDEEGVSERVVAENTFEKAVILNDEPALLCVKLSERIAEVSLVTDHAKAVNRHHLKALIRKILGLTQDVEKFEKTFKTHPVIGDLIKRSRGRRVPVMVSPFEALCWAIMGQQISVSAATSIRRRLIQLTGRKFRGQIICHPTPAEIANRTMQELTLIGLSKTKANSVINISQRVTSGELDLSIDNSPASREQLRETLLAIKGVGPWTVNYTLLRGYGWLDGSLHGDVAFRRNLQFLLKQKDSVSDKQAEQWLLEFTPWRALVVAHIWAAEYSSPE